jgi:hypothetical protein
MDSELKHRHVKHTFEEISTELEESPEEEIKVSKKS